MESTFFRSLKKMAVLEDKKWHAHIMCVLFKTMCPLQSMACADTNVNTEILSHKSYTPDLASSVVFFFHMLKNSSKEACDND